MALTLTLAISATARSLRITGTVPATLGHGYRFRLAGSDELLMLMRFERETGSGSYHPIDRNAWTVERELEDSTATSHTAGAAVLGVADAFVAGDDEDLPGLFPALTAATPAVIGDPALLTPEALGLAMIAAGLAVEE